MWSCLFMLQGRSGFWFWPKYGLTTMETNRQTPLSRERFQALLDAYGADPRRWPSEERQAAQALLAQDARARRLQDEAGQLDRLLDAWQAPEPSAALMGRILAAAPPEPATDALPWWQRLVPLGWLVRSATVMACAGIMGVIIGQHMPPLFPASPVERGGAGIQAMERPQAVQTLAMMVPGENGDDAWIVDPVQVMELWQ